MASSSTPPPPFRLRPATKADMPAMADVFGSAFGTNAIGTDVFGAPALSRTGRAFWLEGWAEDMANPFSRFLVAEVADQHSEQLEKAEGTEARQNEADGIIGFARWVASGAPLPPLPDRAAWPSEGDVDLAVAFFGALHARHGAIMGARSHWYLDLVGVRAGWQGRGVGSALVRWGLERADAEDDGGGLEAYLDATAAGRGVYERYGFRAVEGDVFAGGREVHSYMVRDARSRGGKGETAEGK